MNRTKRRDDWGASPDPKNPDSSLNRGRKPRAKKDTRKWCKGVEGREHVPVLTVQHGRSPCFVVGAYDRETCTWIDNGQWICYHLIACEACGKHLVENTPCPDRPDDAPAQMWLTR